MAFRSSQQARVYIGALAASAYARTAGGASTVDMIDVSTLVDTSKVFLVGQDTGTFNAAGPLDVDATANGQIDLLNTQRTASDPTPVTYLPVGADGASWLVNSIHTQLDTAAGVAGSVDWTLAGQITGSLDLNGVILEDNTTVTADTDGTAVTGPVGGTSQGAAAHLHVTAYSGLTSDDIIIEGSTSGAFAGEETTVFTFTQVTGVTGERVEITGTVPRYLRVVDNVTGTGTITRFVAVSRR
jgi:hypothetical protein